MAQHKALKDAIREKAAREKLTQMMYDQMKTSYQRGLLYGTRAMLGVLGDKIAETDKSPEERLAEVMKIINNMLKMTDKTAEDEKKYIDALISAKPEETRSVFEEIIDKATEIEEPANDSEDDDE